MTHIVGGRCSVSDGIDVVVLQCRIGICDGQGENSEHSLRQGFGVCRIVRGTPVRGAAALPCVALEERIMRFVFVLSALAVIGCGVQSHVIAACAEACGSRGVAEVTSDRCACVSPASHDGGAR